MAPWVPHWLPRVGLLFALLANSGRLGAARLHAKGSAEIVTAREGALALHVHRAEALEAAEREALEAHQAALEGLETQQRQLVLQENALEAQERAILAALEPLDANLEGMSAWSVAQSMHLMALALSGLTGFKAFIPIFVLALRSKLSEACPLQLSGDFKWLESWPVLVVLGLLLLLEFVGDSVAGMDEVLDAVLNGVKPLIAIVITAGTENGEGLASLVFHAVICVVLCGCTAFVKGRLTLAVAAASEGALAPVRGILESLLVTALSLLTLAFVFVAPLVVLACVVLLAVFFANRGQVGSKAKAAARGQ
mmetsp:Transcript_47665/g.102037  ORF Transcript_47665/g.102037 Transcript_47665/m.102037 type:complete len:310 (-) Transcript_47665:64-993(-)